MKNNAAELESEVHSILEDPLYEGHPARQALQKLWSFNQDQWQRMERLTRLSDSYQDMMLQREKSLSERFEKHLRQLEKMTRISDHYQRSLRQLNLELEKTAQIDPLTTLPNRRMIMKRLDQAIESQKGGTNKDAVTVSIAMIDIDYFKQVNDEFGHQVGDDMLVSLGNLMRDIIGQKGIIARWGGEEFLVLLEGLSAMESNELMETLRSEVTQFSMETAKSKVSASASVSIGISTYQDCDGLDSLLSRADDALYIAKSNGRDCVVVG